MPGEIGIGVVGVLAGIGGGIGGSSLMFRFLNAKIDALKKCKQDTKLCDERSGDIQKDLERGEAKFDKIMKIQTDMLVSIEGLTKEIKHFNNGK